MTENAVELLNPYSELEKLFIKEEQIDCPVIHRFSPGIYIREVSIPAGTIAIGHYQKTEHLNVFLKGRVTMLCDDGSTNELTAPMIFVGQPGRKCGYISEDVVWLNVYPTEERDVEKLEEMFLDKSPVFEESIKHMSREIDNQDYIKMLKELGFDDETVRKQSENKDDQIEFPHGGYKVSVSDSDIEGKGLFATATILKNEIIAPARLGGKRTPACRYTNHSINHNAEMIKSGEDIYLKAKREIQGCKGGFLGEEITTDYRKTLDLQRGGQKCQEL